RLIDATGRGLASRDSATAIANMAANLSGQRLWLAMLRGDTAGARSIAQSTAPTWSLRHPVTIAQEALRCALCGEFAQARDLCDEALDTMTGPDATAGDRLA